MIPTLGAALEREVRKEEGDVEEEEKVAMGKGGEAVDDVQVAGDIDEDKEEVSEVGVKDAD